MKKWFLAAFYSGDEHYFLKIENVKEMNPFLFPATNMVPEDLCFFISDSSPSRGSDRTTNKE